MATAHVPDARAPATAVSFEPPTAIPPWPVACGAAVALTPPPIAIASAPVFALAFLPMAIAWVDEAVTVSPDFAAATAPVPDPSILAPPAAAAHFTPVDCAESAV